MKALYYAARFWHQVRKAPYRLLALDYDGTLAPFHVEPMRAYPTPGATEAIEHFIESGHTLVAILSGRPIYEVLSLLGEMELPIVGSHGYETFDPECGLTVRSPDPVQLEGLEQAAEAARQLGLWHKVEVKVGSLALHTRGMPERAASRTEDLVLREWSRLRAPGLGCRRFNGGIEMFSSGWTEGDSLLALLRGQPEGTLPVYIGDDTTDEDVFCVVQSRGLGIKVGPVFTATAAGAFIPDCDGVVAFLEYWLALFSNDFSNERNGAWKHDDLPLSPIVCPSC